MSYLRGKFLSGIAGLSILAGIICGTVQLIEVSVNRKDLKSDPPKVEAPNYLDLEEAELGKVAEIKFKLANVGGHPLLLNKFRKNCACDNLGVKEGDEYVVLESLLLGPGESADVKLSQTVRGLIGKEAVSSLSFATNDPTRPEVFIPIRIPTVTAGVFCVPNVVDFGTLKEGQKKELFFEVFDRENEKISVDRVVCDIPELVRSTFLSSLECPNPPESNPARPFLGLVKLEVVAKRPVIIQGSVSVYLQSRPHLPDTVEIAGRVASMIEIAPASFILPKQSGSGPIYEGTCSIRSNFSEFSIRVTKCPPDLLVDFDPSKKNSNHLLKISHRDPSKIAQIKTNTKLKISFVGIFNGTEIPFEIPILIMGDDT